MKFDKAKESLKNLGYDTKNFKEVNQRNIEDMETKVTQLKFLKDNAFEKTVFKDISRNFNVYFVNDGMQMTPNEIIDAFHSYENSILALNTLIAAKTLNVQFNLNLNYKTILEELKTKDIQAYYKKYEQMINHYQEEWYKFRKFPDVEERLQEFNKKHSETYDEIRFFNEYGHNADEAYAYLILDEYMKNIHRILRHMMILRKLRTKKTLEKIYKLKLINMMKYIIN